jgi:hypothetical protein
MPAAKPMIKAAAKPQKKQSKPIETAVAAPVARVLGLRTCNADMTSHGGFMWPESGFVEAPDWSSEKVCGKGLHFALWGEGDGGLFNWAPDAKWLVLAVNPSVMVDLGGKYKDRRPEVVYCGDRLGATEYLAANGGHGRSIIGGISTAGYKGTATAGYKGTATAGDSGTATAGDKGTATAGDNGTATAGDNGTATAGDNGTATAGDRGTATAGDSGTATAGDNGTISVKWWDDSAHRYRVAIGYVGEGGLKAGVAYRWSYGKWIEAPKS